MLSLILPFKDTLSLKKTGLSLPLASQVVLVLKNLPANSRDVGWIPGSGSSPGGGKWQPIPVFLPENFHGQRSLMGYSPWGRKELYMTECTHTSLPGFP